MFAGMQYSGRDHSLGKIDSRKAHPHDVFGCFSKLSANSNSFDDFWVCASSESSAAPDRRNIINMADDAIG
jgi:hypothetical protein